MKKPEYDLYKQIATYMRYQYPHILYRFDMAGLNLSIAQAGMNKAIQKVRGYPDLFIAAPSNGKAGLFLELKPEGTKLHKKDGNCATPHIKEQLECIIELNKWGYEADFAVGFEDATDKIEDYLTHQYNAATR